MAMTASKGVLRAVEEDLSVGVDEAADCWAGRLSVEAEAPRRSAVVEIRPPAAEEIVDEVAWICEAL